MSQTKNKNIGLYSWYDNKSKVRAIFFDNKNSISLEYDFFYNKINGKKS